MRGAALWAAAGALAAFAVIASASIGLFFALPALIALVLASRMPERWPAAGIGAGVILLVIAWLQRGPENLDARPWFWSGVAVAITGAAFARARRR